MDAIDTLRRPIVAPRKNGTQSSRPEATVFTTPGETGAAGRLAAARAIAAEEADASQRQGGCDTIFALPKGGSRR